MNRQLIEIEKAMYAGVCFYNRLRKTIVEIEGKFVTKEEKKILGLYLGILHTENSISNMLAETELKKDTNVGYKCIDEYEYNDAYEEYFKNFFNSMNFETIEEYFVWLLNSEIIIKLNREYNFNALEFIKTENKQLVKK